jgi:hypothetical protein
VGRKVCKNHKGSNKDLKGINGSSLGECQYVVTHKVALENINQNPFSLYNFGALKVLSNKILTTHHFQAIFSFIFMILQR